MRKRLAILEPGALRQAVAQWFAERVDLAPVVALAAKKTVPVHRSSWIYLLGGSALFLFGLQVVGGSLLMLYYQPGETTSHESVGRIMTEVPFGSVVRSVHAWGAHFFIAVLVLHFLAKLFSRAYRKPREITWISGMLLIFLALAFGFSGYLLPWNELSYHATNVGTAIPGAVLGDWVGHFLLGGAEVTGDTVTRFFAAHVIFLPLACGLLLVVHLGMIQSQGMSLPLGTDKAKVRDAIPFFSEFILIEACIWLVLLGVIVTLAVTLPAEVGLKADPLADTPENIKPEWYFLFMFQTLKLVPQTPAVLLFSLAAVFLVAVPFIDRRASREEPSRGFTALFVALVVYAAGFEIWAALIPGPEHPPVETTSKPGDFSGGLVSLALFWTAIGFLVFYLRLLLKENVRVRRLYRDIRPTSDVD